MNDVENVNVMFLGESCARKTEIVSRLVNDSPIRSSFVSKVLEFNEFHKSIKFDIWDTAGQEKYRGLSNIFYQQANVIVFVYDITCKESFNAIKSYWWKEVQSCCKSDPILAVLGNRFNEEEVSEEEGREFARSINAIFQLISSKKNTGIDNLLDTIGRQYLEKKKMKL